MSSTLSTVFHAIFPVFFLIGLGYVLFKKQFLTREIQQGLNKIAYWIGLPAFLFYKVANAKFQAGTTGNIFACVMAGTASSMIIAYIMAKFNKMERSSRGASIQAGGRGNLAFIALPIVIYSVNLVAPERADTLIDSAILVLTPMVIIYNLISVSILTAHSDTESEDLMKDIVSGLIKNPLIISCVLGLSWNLLGFTITEGASLHRICESLGRAAFPMALLGIGCQLAQIPSSSRIMHAAQISLIKCVLAPLVGFALSRVLNMDNSETLVTLILLSTPTAVAAYVLADQLNCDADLTAGVIACSTTFSFVSFSTILIIFQ